MSEMRQARVGRSEDDLNELMPMHSRKLAQAEDADGETVGLNEYLSSGVRAKLTSCPKVIVLIAYYLSCLL